MAQYTKVPEHGHSENPLLPLITDPNDPLAPIALRSTQLEMPSAKRRVAALLSDLAIR